MVRNDNPIDTEDFREWLRANTNLLEGSINLYVRTIRSFLDKYPEINLDNINDFVSKSFRQSHSYYVKYSFRPFLQYMDQEDLYKKIVPVKMKPRKKLGKYLPEEMIRQIIQNIRKQEMQDIATLQYATGARARGIITLKEENIDKDFDENVIRLRLEEKGGKESMTFLDRRYGIVLDKYMRGSPGYLFLPGRLVHAEEPELERAINTKRTYFYNKLRESAMELGHDHFGTHDFRRNVVEILKKKGTPLPIIQKVLGHSNIRTTLRYFDDNPEQIQDTIIGHQNARHTKE